MFRCVSRSSGCNSYAIALALFQLRLILIHPLPPPLNIPPGWDGAIEKIDSVLAALPCIPVRKVEQRRQQIT
jgi:hypothetical protein